MRVYRGIWSGLKREPLVAVLLVAALVFAAIAWATHETFYLRLATEGVILAGLALSVDLLLGYTGLFSLGQALYFGLGAYVTALLLLHDPGWGFWGALICSLLASSLVALIVGAVVIRSRGVYFILITFGLAQVVATSVYNIRQLGGSDGLTGIPVLKVNFLLFHVDLGDPVSFFLFAVAVIGILYAFLSYLIHTPLGHVLVAIRSNDQRVRFLGYDSWRYKLVSYVIAADVAAVAGTLYPLLRGFVSPELMYFGVSADAVIMTIIGGVGTLIGPIYGSLILISLKTFISGWTQHHGLVVGAVFIATVVFLPAGLVGFLRTRSPRTAVKAAEGAHG
jgi:branched-chain amino acid transport system permease protein